MHSTKMWNCKAARSLQDILSIHSQNWGRRFRILRQDYYCIAAFKQDASLVSDFFFFLSTLAERLIRSVYDPPSQRRGFYAFGGEYRDGKQAIGTLITPPVSTPRTLRRCDWLDKHKREHESMQASTQRTRKKK